MKKNLRLIVFSLSLYAFSLFEPLHTNAHTGNIPFPDSLSALTRSKLSQTVAAVMPAHTDAAISIDKNTDSAGAKSDSAAAALNDLDNNSLDSVASGELALKKMDHWSIASFFDVFKKNVHNQEGSDRRKLLSKKAYFNMAIIMARLKNYPLALKYFSYADALENTDVSDKKYKLGYDSSLFDFPTPDLLTDSAQKHNLVIVGQDTLLLDNKGKTPDSKPISNKALMEPFRDSEEGLAYGIMLHLKQPSAGKRKQYALINNVGHMFITLIKFEREGKAVSRTFGFYPQKENLLSATPLMPATNSVFKNDSLHLWDETVGKFISYKQFKLVLKMVRKYSHVRYHLNKNNCTDFGLCVAAIAGIDIGDTQGSWPLGKGNDPGDTGQSILEGKVENVDTSSKAGLFICTNEMR